MRETCPNCGYEFAPRAIQAKGARAKWDRMTTTQKVAAIARMVEARKAKRTGKTKDK